MSGRSGHVAVAYNGKLYVFGGFTEQGATKDFMEYNPELDSWKVLNNVPAEMPRRSHCSGALNGSRLYIYAGHSNLPEVENDLDDLWEYNFETGRWIERSKNPYRMSAHTATFFNGRMYVFGGDSNYPGNAPIMIYDPVKDIWEDRSAPYGYIHKAVAFSYKDSIYIYAGNNPENTNHLRRYDPRNNTYERLADGLEAVNSPALVLDGDEIRVFGGNNFDKDWCSDLHSAYRISEDRWSVRE